MCIFYTDIICSLQDDLQIIFMEFIGVTLVPQTTQVSKAQHNSAQSAHCAVRRLLQAKSLCLRFLLPFASSTHPPPISPSGYHHTVVCV